jgi:hypothetical protein
VLDEGLDHSAVGTRIHEQAEQFDRHASSELLNARKFRNKPMRGVHPGVWGAQFGGKAGIGCTAPSSHEHQVGDWLDGHPDKVHGEHKPLTHKNLVWSYKATPHAPASVFLKYLVHRINNVDLYDDHEAGHKADVDFLKLHSAGNAGAKNGHVTPDDLHQWTKRWSPTIVPELLSERARVQGIVRSGVGMNVRDIDGQPYVAVTRGLNGDMMNREHTLSSWSDKANSGFGTHQHQAWVPLKDLWWAYDYGSPYESDTLGSEDEFLFSNTGPRYEATEDDVKPSRIKSAWGADGEPSSFPYAGHLDTATDEQVVQALDWHKKYSPDGQPPLSLQTHPNAGPKSQAYLESIGWRGAGVHLLASTPRERVMAEANPESASHFTRKTFQNPNLTREDVQELGLRMLRAPNAHDRRGLAYGFADANKVDTQSMEAVWDAGAKRDPTVATELLSRPTASPRMLQEATELITYSGMGKDRKMVHGSYAALGPESYHMADAVFSNPQHTEAQADAIIASQCKQGQASIEAYKAQPSYEFLSKCGRAMKEPSKENEIFPDATEVVGGGGKMARQARAILKNYSNVCPHPKPEYLRSLLDHGYIAPEDIATRVKHDLTFPPEVQVPVIAKLIKSGDSVQHHPSVQYLSDIASAKDLTPEAVALLAHCPYVIARDKLFKNRHVTPETLEAAWPKGMERPQTPTDPKLAEAHLREMVNSDQPNTFEHLATAIWARKAYAERRAREHLIKPFPSHLGKSEAAWAIELRNWVAKLGQKTGYYYPCTRAEADDAMHHVLLHPTPTEDLLDGEAVFANRASPEFVKKWQKTATPDQALVYFETTVEPEQAPDGRFYWTSVVPLDHAHVVEPGTSMEKHEELTGLGRVLAKMHGPVTFPRLGVPDDRRESYIISSKKQLDTKARAMAQQDVNELKGKVGDINIHLRTNNPRALNSTRSATKRAVNEGMNAGMAFQYGGGYAMAPNKWSGVPYPAHVTKNHEDMHLLLSRVQAKYGREGRKKLVANLFEALPSDLRPEVIGFASARSSKGTRNPDNGYHEEWLTYLTDYINDAGERERYHTDPLERRIAHDKMKRAYKAARAAAEVATPAWTQHYKPWLVRANTAPGTQTDFAETRGPFGPYAHTQEPYNLWGTTTRPQSRLWTGQFVRKTELPPEGDPMLKGMKGLVMAGALALAPGLANTTDSGPIEGPPDPTPAQVQAMVPVEKLHPHLKAIGFLESGNGRDVNHAKNPTEFNTAWGELGLKPVTAHDVWLHSPNLQKKYPNLEKPDDFMEAFKRLPGLHNGCANRHWNTLLGDFKGDQKRAAYGWRWGRTAAHNAKPEDIEGDDYVQKFAQHPSSGVRPDMQAKNPTKLGALHKSLDPTTLEPEEAKAALAQLGHNPQVDKTLRAASFLVGNKVKVNEDAFALALQVHDGDIERAALYAVGLTDSDKNVKALKAVLSLGSWDEQTPMELTKAEEAPQVPVISSVQPAVPGAEDTADAVGRAVTAGLLQPLKLKGKHAAGATAAKDPQTGYIVLLKPGSGKQSPAAGSRDDKSSQSAREACFYHVAKECGLGNYYPRCDLLIVNAQEWAAMAMLGAQWKGLDEYNRSEDGRGREVLTPYLKRGDIHRLAAMDWILGNPDSHGQNIMTHGDAVALIDHGSAFAGPGFNPGLDTKSFIPYYLRLFGSRGISKLSPEERVKTLPVLDAETDTYLWDWVDDLKPGVIDSIMKEYGIGEVGRKAVLDRLHGLQTFDGDNLSAYLDGLWAGLKPEDMKKSEPLEKHSRESFEFFPGDSMAHNADRYEWPKPFDHPEVVAKRRQDAERQFFIDWVNKLETSPAYKRWEKAHGETKWEYNAEHQAVKTGSPEALEAEDLSHKLRHNADYKPYLKWAEKHFPGAWTSKHDAALAKVQKDSVEGGAGHDDSYNSETRYWLSQMQNNLGAIKDPAVRRAFKTKGRHAVSEWLEKKFSPAQQKRLIQQVFPQAFTKKKDYQNFDIEPHPTIVNGIKNGVITMNFPSNKLGQMNRAGKYLNLHETGMGLGENDQDTRGEHEEQKFGIDMGTDASYRPVYGALNWATKHHPAHAHFGAAPMYGDSWLELKPEVRDRASFTPGDSFGVEPQQVFSHRTPEVLAHSFQQMESGNKHSVIHGKPGDRWSDYVEAQIFGGVDFKRDVRALHLGPENAGLRRTKEKGERVSPYDKVIEQARAFGAKHGVPVYMHSPDKTLGYTDTDTDKLRAAPAHAVQVVTLFQPGDKFKPKKGVPVEEEVERYVPDEDDDHAAHQERQEARGRQDEEAYRADLADLKSPVKHGSVAMRAHYDEHLPKLTAAFEAMVDPAEKSKLDALDTSFHAAMDKGKHSDMVDHPFAAWARTIVPEFGAGFKGAPPADPEVKALADKFDAVMAEHAPKSKKKFTPKASAHSPKAVGG